MDLRVKRLAELLVNYSLDLKKGQLFKIKGQITTMPLINAVYEEALKVGAYPFVQITNPDTEELFYKYASKDQLNYITPMTKLETNKLDSLLVIWGSANTKYLSRADLKKQNIANKARTKLMQRFFKRIADKSMTWCGTQFPTEADAQDAEMSLTDYEDFVYKAGHVHAANPAKHWKKVSKEQQRLVKILNRFDKIHVQSPNCDLKLRVKGRKWINCDGRENFPDGEIFTSPIEDTVEGYIHYTYPAVYQGREVDDVRFEFKKGKVVNETAGKNLQYLQSMLNVDKGGRYIGEFAIGTNYEIKQFSRNTLFDEKIGGTCHLAVGASILESGGKNVSAIHWDMVCDLKKKSEIRADGKLIYKNGKFTI